MKNDTCTFTFETGTGSGNNVPSWGIVCLIYEKMLNHRGLITPMLTVYQYHLMFVKMNQIVILKSLYTNLPKSFF